MQVSLLTLQLGYKPHDTHSRGNQRIATARRRGIRPIKAAHDESPDWERAGELSSSGNEDTDSMFRDPAELRRLAQASRLLDQTREGTPGGLYGEEFLEWR